MINEKEDDEKKGHTGGSAPPVALFCQDLMFSVRLQNMARTAGLAPMQTRPGSALPHAGLTIVDLNSRADWRAAIEEAAAHGSKVVAFGPHTDAQSRKVAKGAGASRVLANSNLERDLPAILAEYAREAEG